MHPNVPTSTTTDNDNIRYRLPQKYKLERVLGEGVYGRVLKCWDSDTRQTVAIKMPHFYNGNQEAVLMQKLMFLDFDRHNIVKFHNLFPSKAGEALVFEALDKSLEDYFVSTQHAPLQLGNIRTIVQQVATALEALKSIGIIHTDIKMDNIMLVDQDRKPFQLKLIDFGLAVHRSDVNPDMIVQPVSLRAPEVLLGLHFSEAIDIWALGCMMFKLLTGHALHSATSELEAMKFIVKILGQPPDHLLNKGTNTKTYFKRTFTKVWKRKALKRIKTPKGYKQTLDDLKNNNKAKAAEWDQCIELLKAMLKLDPKERITPSEILKHPFITSGQARNNAGQETPHEFSNCGPSATAPTTNNQPDHRSHSPTVFTSGGTKDLTLTGLDADSDTSLKVHVNNIPGCHTSRENKVTDCEPPATDVKDDVTTSIQPDHDNLSPTALPVGGIMVSPTDLGGPQTPRDTCSETQVSNMTRHSAPPPKKLSNCRPPARVHATTRIKPEYCTPRPTIQASGYTGGYVPTFLGDLETDSDSSWETHVNNKPRCLPSPLNQYYNWGLAATAPKDIATTNIKADQHYQYLMILPSGLIVEHCTSQENHVNNMQRHLPIITDAFCNLSSATQPSGMITGQRPTCLGSLETDSNSSWETPVKNPPQRRPLTSRSYIINTVETRVQPANAENTSESDIDESSVSLQADQNTATGSPVKQSAAPTGKPQPDTTTCVDVKPKMKKKNCIQRFLSWMRKSVTCRVTPVIDDEIGKSLIRCQE